MELAVRILNPDCATDLPPYEQKIHHLEDSVLPQASLMMELGQFVESAKQPCNVR